MIATQFNPLSWAHTYAQRHLQTDPGICGVYYLPEGASEREIRLVEVNELLAVIETETNEPIEFGVDREDARSDDAHTVKILDVSPGQWARIGRGELPLPQGWSLAHMRPFDRN